MTTSGNQSIAGKAASVVVVAGFLLASVFYAPLTGSALNNVEPKGKIKCWVSCCPLEIGCTYNLSATRTRPPNADITIKDGMLIAEFKPTGDQKVYEVKTETKLNSETADGLGFKEVTLLPGQYPVTPLRNGLAKVAIRVRTVAK